MKKELESFRQTSDEVESALENASSVKDSYEVLMNVQKLYEAGQTPHEEMMEMLLTIKVDNLGEGAKAEYDLLTGDIYPKMCDRIYKKSKKKLESQNFQEAVEGFEKIRQMNEGYENGMALKLLGDAYAGQSDLEKSAEIYQKVIESYPESEAAKESQKALDER